MPGPGNKGKAKKKTTGNAISKNPLQGASNQPPAPVVLPCQTLEEDEMTRCNQPATEGHPHPERCKIHQKHYRTMYKKYKDAAKLVDDIKQGDGIPTREQIERYTDVASILQKCRFVRKYVEAVRVERTGRDIHSRRFFLKVDNGHEIRIKVLAKEMIKGVEALDGLQSRAYNLHVGADPLLEWVKTPTPFADDVDEFSTEKLVQATEKMEFPTRGTPDNSAPATTTELEDRDLIDLKI